ncbi:hypothetical protein K437DRAFT_27449 [Tilletiaria anomala UBC 951]|uniref:N-alpha-acetyltransferase 40 n=1 Tax=Tilletiaria anomala (strain ATCC 24038 / CBS 436.72 / UBC 951) TaxID=1037660 RepID=A0A066VDG7_TILAU|nr:uncharacterized protein K437DRAFT_27449 [Tilletiaria anomala UBC 951]KDN38323.1 hypothetical protein K437DRAFT_27449 [Tilletiaria anomala UBC 951]
MIGGACVTCRTISDTSHTASPSFFLRIEVSVTFAHELNRDLETEIMKLLELNMRPLYDQSAQGWNRREKLKEMREAPSRFLLARASVRTRAEDALSEGANVSAAGKGELVGYTMFRLDFEECDEDDPLRLIDEQDIELAYCYELQVAPPYRGKGVGQFLLGCLEDIAKASRMKKVMLTAFLHNRSALEFYRAQGYTPDLISPQETDGDGHTIADYQILSKALVQPARECIQRARPHVQSQ